MILSLSHRFIFVHIPKTAGTAMAEALERHSANPERTIWRSVMRRLPIREQAGRAYFRKHDPASRIVAKLGREEFDRFQSFSVVRDPYDHAVSHFEFMKQFRIRHVARRISTMTFEEYLAYRVRAPFWDDTFFARLPDQSFFLTDAAGKVIVGKIIRFECLSSEFPALVEKLGLGNTKLEHVNRTKTRSDRRPFQSYYDATTEEMVRKLYARDFDLLGYDRAMRPA